MDKLKYILSIFFLFAAAAGAWAQLDYDPRTTWPFIYEEFKAGVVQDSRGQGIPYDQLNVSVANGRLHFIQDGVIMESDMATFSVIRIGEDTYRNSMGRLMRVLKETEHGAVLEFIEVDTAEMEKSDIGYGKSSLASTQKISAVGQNGMIVPNIINQNLDVARLDKENGQVLALRTSLYLIVDGHLVRARKNDVFTDPQFNRDATFKYLKEKKTKWDKVDQLADLVEFLHEQKAAGANAL